MSTTPEGLRRAPSTALVLARARNTSKATRARAHSRRSAASATFPVSAGPSSGRGFSGSDFGPTRDAHRAPDGYGMRGTDMGMGERLEDRGPHYGKGPKGYQRSDARIHEDVCETIAHQGHIDATEVEVKVERGIVTLSGTVRERQDKRGLEQLVEHTLGVEDVHNQIRLARSAAAAKGRAEPVADAQHGKALRS